MSLIKAMNEAHVSDEGGKVSDEENEENAENEEMIDSECEREEAMIILDEDEVGDEFATAETQPFDLMAETAENGSGIMSETQRSGGEEENKEIEDISVCLRRRKEAIMQELGKLIDHTCVIEIDA